MAHSNAPYGSTDTFCSSRLWSDLGPAERSADRRRFGDSVGHSKGCGTANFEVIDGVLYRKKLEKGFVNYREVLDEDRRCDAISTFHRRRPGQRHLSLEETYKCVAENYWWEGMYFQIRDFVLCCQECRNQHIKKSNELGGRTCVSKTVSSHSADVLSKLRSQREAGLFCDITLRTSGKSYTAHKAVLAAVSDHFQEIFTETDSSSKPDIDLTGFREESLLSLLDFSYSSTLSVHQEDLPEVITMARHLGMWPAVEACSALMKEQERQSQLSTRMESSSRDLHHQQREGKRKRTLEDKAHNSFSLMLDTSDPPLKQSPRHSLRNTLTPQGHNGLPVSPSHRMKLMDFKSPSSKKATISQNSVASPRSQNYPPLMPSNTRLLRSTPGASQEVQRLLPMPETPRRKRDTHTVTRLSRSVRSRPGAVCSPNRVKQEVNQVGEDEEDYARAQEKYKLMNVLGLQRTALLPRPEDLIGWRQKKRLRKLKANNYSLTKRRKPRLATPGVAYGDVPLALPLCSPVTTRFLSRTVKAKTAGAGSTEQITAKRRSIILRHIPPSDRSMRSKGGLPDILQPPSRLSFRGKDMRRSVRKGDSAQIPAQQPLHRGSTKTLRNKVTIKVEPADCSISGRPFPSSSQHGHTPRKPLSSLTSRARNKVGVENVRTLRYNRCRSATKNKLRRYATREVGKMKCKTSVERKKSGSQGPKATDGRLRIKDQESGELQILDHTPPPSLYSHPLYKAIKEEPLEPLPVVGSFSDPSSPDLGKRQSKPPIKLLDSGFLFSFCRPTGGPMAGLKKEEESVDICLTRSVSQMGQNFGAEESQHRALRTRAPATLSPVKREEKSASQSKVQRSRPESQNAKLRLTKPKVSRVTQLTPKSKLLSPSGRSCVMFDSVQRARIKQLRGPRSQAPKAPKVAHACLQCQSSFRDCDALIMHQLRHVEGKHWPCLLCSKTFFRLRNVRNHIRTHDSKLYKCRSCIIAAS
ncbi:uncharacterized protein si:dkey-229b18.3 isoform X2 [Thalassophryne amazonica]|uniref:uncharacterized protein si:dkey-229b18.3 isoform X2 n=1 Tax=Thalassophryne amazonica TaxID=390379 RepID=UPI0014719EC4|nr:uncharacterized protein si:dkey-229b18.3 isoform X2 [Thalassophryne amazonica]